MIDPEFSARLCGFVVDEIFATLQRRAAIEAMVREFLEDLRAVECLDGSVEAAVEEIMHAIDCAIDYEHVETARQWELV